MAAITLFTTGGTIDKVYDEIQGKLSFKETHLEEILKQGRSSLQVEVHELFLVDSLEMSELQRQEIVDGCSKSTNTKIVITHGTDTMVETAAALAKEKLQKTIVLTGAMIPYTIKNSDSLFNLGSALAFVQTLPTGIYIAMNGSFFLWNDVQKNKSLGEFENL
mgnify:CR=1 FL=1